MRIGKGSTYSRENTGFFIVSRAETEISKRDMYSRENTGLKSKPGLKSS